MTTIENNRCYACGKLFCCADCCKEHVKTKHQSRDSECPLCRSERLSVKNFDNQAFLCHVVFHHLPLWCRMCGLKFNNCEELQSLGICNRPVACDPDAVRKSLLSPGTTSSFDKTPRAATITGTKEFKNARDYNGNFGNLTSPPEFTRHTSTPMHVNLTGSKANFVFKTPKSPNFSLKTPKTPKATGAKSTNPEITESTSDKENDSSNCTKFKDLESYSSSCSDTNYLSCSGSSRATGLTERTPLRSILSNRSSMMSEGSSCATRSNSAGRKLGSMRELNEDVRTEDIVDMDLTDTHGFVEIDDASPQTAAINSDYNRNKDFVKRVRFSDQFEIKNETETTSTSDLDATDNEEFYEARQSLTDLSMAVMEELSSSTALINHENEKNIEKEKKRECDDTSSNRTEFSDSARQNDTSSASSKVIMMVVVEKNGSVNDTDLVPLIKSSLKKLVAIPSNSFENLPVSPTRDNENRPSGTSVVSIDSYMSVSTVECYKTPGSTLSLTKNSRDTTENSNSGGGIFAAMAQAMRTAFRNLSGANSTRNVSREPIGQRENLSLLSSMPEANLTSSKVVTSLTSALVPRTAKRTRDTDEISSVRSPDNGDPVVEVRSPVPKRPRGWCKIRARDPIARMRSNVLTSPRGVSSETQCFQQGSLTAGDTILPLPSRAHQSTQTD